MDDNDNEITAESGGMIQLPNGTLAPLMATAMFVLRERREEFAEWMRTSDALPYDASNEEIIATVAAAGLAAMGEINRYEEEECPIHGHGPRADAARARITRQIIADDDPDGWNLDTF